MTIARMLMCGTSILVAAMSLAGCGNKEPAGQVVALVDGQEVTRRDVATEPVDGRLGAGGNQPVILGGVIDRKLAAAEARKLDLDRTPDYVAQAQRLEEVMLSRSLFARWAEELPEPSAKAVADYIGQNPQRFDARKLLLTDRIQASASAISSQALKPLLTADAVAEELRKRSQPFERGQLVLDSATLSPEIYQRLRTLRASEPLAIPQGDKLVVLAIQEVRDAPLPQAERKAAAAAALKEAAIRKRLADLRNKATIAYQAGYRPVDAQP